jgi:hypothetical protein
MLSLLTGVLLEGQRVGCIVVDAVAVLRGLWLRGCMFGQNCLVTLLGDMSSIAGGWWRRLLKFAGSFQFGG